MRKDPASRTEKPRGLGAATSEIVGLFDVALTERDLLREWIDELPSKANATLRDRLCLALYRHQLAFREPPLSTGVSLTGASVQEYWATHPRECEEYLALEDEIWSYLISIEELELKKVRQMAKMLDIIQQDQITFAALYPVVEDIFKNPAGRRISRPNVAVRALQLKIDTGRSWEEIAAEVCDCGKSVHDDYCRENLRQSVRRLRVLLQKCGVEVPST